MAFLSVSVHYSLLPYDISLFRQTALISVGVFQSFTTWNTTAAFFTLEIARPLRIFALILHAVDNQNRGEKKFYLHPGLGSPMAYAHQR